MPYAEAADGARIYYRVKGPARAEPVVLIMGLGWDMTGWQLMMPLLSRYRVLRLDNRGTGRSAKPDEPYSIRQMAGDVVRCMNAAGMDSAHVYGASLGSMIAQPRDHRAARLAPLVAPYHGTPTQDRGGVLHAGRPPALWHLSAAAA